MFRSPRAAAVALITAYLAGSALVTAPAAQAATKCTTSSASIDNPDYVGPWPDNYDFSVKTCAWRSGGTVYAKAYVTFDGYGSADPSITFNAAYFRIYVKKSLSGPDPVMTYKTHNVESKLESGGGSFTTSTISYPVGSTRGLADSAVKLDWNGDGAGLKHRGFSASPTV